MSSDLHRRLGRFTISRHLIESDPRAIARRMAGMIVVRAETMWASDGVEYTAISPEFDVVEPNSIIPEYSLEIQSGHVVVTGLDVTHNHSGVMVDLAMFGDEGAMSDAINAISRLYGLDTGAPASATKVKTPTAKVAADKPLAADFGAW